MSSDATEHFISLSLQKVKQISKMQKMKSNLNREKYKQIYEWSKKQLIKLQKLLQKQQESKESVQLYQQQKKVIISMILQITRITKQQCMQKGLMIEQILKYALKFINQHQKYYDMLSYTQIKHFRDSIQQTQKEYIQKNAKLNQQIALLTKDKEHRWRNLYMVVKDNRVLRRQRAKLMQKNRQEIWKVKLLEEDLINLRSQNQKYKLMCEQYSVKQAQNNQFKNYMSNQLLLFHLDQKIKKYPLKARKLLKKQLLNCQINELNSLNSKIKYIIQAMDENNEICQQFDDWDDGIQTTRLFYNVSVQTYIDKESVGTNTITPVVPTKTFHSTRTQTRVKDLFFLEQHSKIIDLKINSTMKKTAPRRKQTHDFNNSNSMNLSRFKRKGSISSNNSQFNNTNDFGTNNMNLSRTFIAKNKFRICNSIVSVRIVNTATSNKVLNKINRNITSIAIDLNQNVGNLPEQEGKNQNRQQSKNKIKKLRNTSINGLNLPKHFIQGKDIEQSGQRSRKLLSFFNQGYQLYFRPAQAQINNKQQIKMGIENNNLSEFQNQKIKEFNKNQGKRAFFLQEKVLQQKTKKQSKKNKQSGEYNSMPKQNNPVLNKSLQHKFKGTESHYVKHAPQSIIQVVETTSNRSLQSNCKPYEQQKQQKTIGNKKVKKQANMQNQNVKTQKNKLHKLTKNESQENVQKNNKSIILITNKNDLIRHRRQKTQNLQNFSFKKRANLQQIKQNSLQKVKTLQSQFQMSYYVNQNSTCMATPLQQKTKIKRSSKIVVSYKGLLQKSNDNKQNQKYNKNYPKNDQQKQNTVCKKNTNIFNSISSDDRYCFNSQKILQKLLVAIHNKKNQIIKHPISFRMFLLNFLSNFSIFKSTGNHNNQAGSRIKPISKFAEILRNGFHHSSSSLQQISSRNRSNICFIFSLVSALLQNEGGQAFAEDMFVLLAVMIQKLCYFGVIFNHNSIEQIFCVPKEYGIKVIQYICSIYLNQAQTNKFMCQLSNNSNTQQNAIPQAQHQQFKTSYHRNQNINMIQFYLKLVQFLRHIVFDSQIWNFLSSLSIWTTQSLNFENIQQIFFSLGILKVQNWSHFQQMQFYADKRKNFTLHKLCLFAYRFQWHDLYSIKKWIDSKYLQLYGVFSLQQDDLNIFVKQIQIKMIGLKKYKYLMSILQQVMFKNANHLTYISRKDKPKNSFGKVFSHKSKAQMSKCSFQTLVKLCLLSIQIIQLQNLGIFSQNLKQIQNLYRKVVKNQYKNQLLGTKNDKQINFHRFSIN